MKGQLRVALLPGLPLLLLAAIAWLLTARQAFDMSAMVTGLGQLGARMPNDIAPPAFMSMWLLMMVAMMFPAIAPMVLTYDMVVSKRPHGRLLTAVFVAGYLLVWTAIGVVPLLAFLAFRSLMSPAGWVQPAAGAALVAAGLYQFTPWKTACLRVCQSPLSFVMTHDFRTGSKGAVLAGISHGAWCLGCCWALMLLLVVVGLMNLLWMAALSIVFVLEKNWKRGNVVSRVAGAAIVLLGVAVLAAPPVLSVLSNLHG